MAGTAPLGNFARVRCAQPRAAPVCFTGNEGGEEVPAGSAAPYGAPRALRGLAARVLPGRAPQLRDCFGGPWRGTGVCVLEVVLRDPVLGGARGSLLACDARQSQLSELFFSYSAERV